MELDIYTDARSQNISKAQLLEDPNLFQKKLQISALIVDENESEFRFAQKTTTDSIVSELGDLSGMKFKADSTIGEMYSIYKILTFISKYMGINESGVMSIINDNYIKRVNIYTDSLSSFNYINEVMITPLPNQKRNPIPKPHSPKNKLSKSLNSRIISFKRTLESIGVEVNIMWIKGHVGVWGNEIADGLCKKSQRDINEIHQILSK